MAQVHITELKCIRRKDLGKYDEPVIFLDGIRVWNGKIEKDQLLDQGLDVRKTFSDTVHVELKENNGGDLDSNNTLLGSWTLGATPHAPSMLTATSSGYHYQVFYHVD
jgi:hypothetical protein